MTVVFNVHNKICNFQESLQLKLTYTGKVLLFPYSALNWYDMSEYLEDLDYRDMFQ